MQGQTVLGVVFWEDLHQTANEPFGLLQGERGTAEVAGVLQGTQPTVTGRWSGHVQNLQNIKSLPEPSQVTVAVVLFIQGRILESERVQTTVTLVFPTLGLREDLK